MIHTEKFKAVAASYKSNFSSWWENEKYKWEALQHFQKHWDMDTENFAEMFKKATEKTYNLLASGYAYPRATILNFAQADPKATRRMFQILFDESLDLEERVVEFQSAAEQIRQKHTDGTWNKHYQNTNAISTYLWLRYPDKYYIYKYDVYRDVALELGGGYKPKKDGSVETMMDGYKYYDEIHKYILEDKEFAELFDKVYDSSCYEDPHLRTVLMDFGYFLSRVYVPKLKERWIPENYSPDITKEEWGELLNDRSVFTLNSLQIMKRLKESGGQATCKQLSQKYGETPNFYNAGSSALARRVAERTECPLYANESGDSKWWPILYKGKKVDSDGEGGFMWQLRSELSEALNMIDLSHVPLNVNTKPAIWKISHGTESTGISYTNKMIFEKRKVTVVHGTTKAKASSKVTQGVHFIETIKKGDFFYLCYGNSIRLFGEFTTEEAVLNPELESGWYERPYKVVAVSKDTTAYTATKKWWTPNDNSTCIRVDEQDQSLFEQLILKPYFDLTLDDLIKNLIPTQSCWWLAANPRIWRFSDMKIGEEQSFPLFSENGNKRHIHQNFLEVKAEDLVIGFEGNPSEKIVALGKITQASDGDRIYFEKTESLSVPVELKTIKRYPELQEMEFSEHVFGNLFKVTQEECNFLMDLIREENPVKPQASLFPPYNKENFLNTVYMTEERYDVLESLLKSRKNVILQGAPGVGKTFTAKKLAYAMMGEEDDTRIEMVQFHQNYSYEDFVMGFRPEGSDFKLTEGIFYRFCQRARNFPDKYFFFIIDEINRGNMSKILGELLMLIEREYRGTRITLAYSGTEFSVPENVYIIGMMNTADRSLAMIDYALRRRFSFFEMEPGFNSDGFQTYQNNFENETFNTLIDQVRRLNKVISEDKSLGKGFRIGHSYFCGRKTEECTLEWMRSIVEFDILPTLTEYWFDDEVKLMQWEKNLRGMFDD